MRVTPADIEAARRMIAGQVLHTRCRRRPSFPRSLALACWSNMKTCK
jgi:hypothetical protein